MQHDVILPQQKIVSNIEQPELLAIFENDFAHPVEVKDEKSDSFAELLELDLLQSRKKLEVAEINETALIEPAVHLPLFEEQIMELQKDE